MYRKSPEGLAYYGAEPVDPKTAAFLQKTAWGDDERILRLGPLTVDGPLHPLSKGGAAKKPRPLPFMQVAFFSSSP